MRVFCIQIFSKEDSGNNGLYDSIFTFSIHYFPLNDSFRSRSDHSFENNCYLKTFIFQATQSFVQKILLTRRCLKHLGRQALREWKLFESMVDKSIEYGILSETLMSAYKEMLEFPFLFFFFFVFKQCLDKFNCFEDWL